MLQGTFFLFATQGCGMTGISISSADDMITPVVFRAGCNSKRLYSLSILIARKHCLGEQMPS